MEQINACYVLDCSGSMIEMPKEGITILKNNIKDLEKVEPTKTKLIKIIEFGDVVNSFDFELKDLEEKFPYKTWKSSMGKTSLYDAISTAVLQCKQSGGLITIITDGKENESWLSKEIAVALLKKFRKDYNGKVMLIGPGDREFLENCIGGQADSIFPMSIDNTHEDIVDCLSSQEHTSAYQLLISSCCSTSN
jgi:uncharacterized protein YegL